MDRLIAGLQRFQQQVFPENRERFAQLTHGQRPGTLFIACADAPVPPTLFTQAEPGEMLLIQNAGNIVPPLGAPSASVGASIEFAALALGVRHIVICGHTGCAAMARLLRPETLAGMPAMGSWLSHAEAARRTVRETAGNSSHEELLGALVRQNVVAQLNNLTTHPAVISRLSAGGLTLHGWVYDGVTGTVEYFNEAQHRYLPLDGPLPPDSSAVPRTTKQNAFACHQPLGFEHFL